MYGFQLFEAVWSGSGLCLSGHNQLHLHQGFGRVYEDAVFEEEFNFPADLLPCAHADKCNLWCREQNPIKETQRR